MSRIIETNKLDTNRYEPGSVSEYKIGHTTYIVRTYFDLECEDTPEDVVQRLVNREVDRIISAD